MSRPSDLRDPFGRLNLLDVPHEDQSKEGPEKIMFDMFNILSDLAPSEISQIIFNAPPVLYDPTKIPSKCTPPTFETPNCGRQEAGTRDDVENEFLAKLIPLCFSDVIDNFVHPDDPRKHKILEIGAGNGHVSRMIKQQLSPEFSLKSTDALDHGNPDVECLIGDEAVDKYGANVLTLLFVSPPSGLDADIVSIRRFESVSGNKTSLLFYCGEMSHSDGHPMTRSYLDSHPNWRMIVGLPYSNFTCGRVDCCKMLSIWIFNAPPLIPGSVACLTGLKSKSEWEGRIVLVRRQQ